MAKFNGAEHYLLQRALTNHVKELEEEILRAEKTGNRSLFAPGYFTMIGKELQLKIDNNTIKKDLKANQQYITKND